MYNLLSKFFKHRALPKEQLDYIVDEVEKRLSPKIIKDMSLTDANYIGARLSAIAKDFKPVNILQEDLVDITLPPIAPSDLPLGETKQPDVSELAKLTPDEFKRKLYGSPSVSQQRECQNVRPSPSSTSGSPTTITNSIPINSYHISTLFNTTASNTHLDRNDTWITTPVFIDNTPSHSCSHSASSDYSSSTSSCDSSDYSSSTSSCDSSSSSGGWD